MIENEQGIIDAIDSIRHPQDVADEKAYYQDDAVKALEARWAAEATLAGDDADQPVRDEPIALVISRDKFGDWRISMTTEHGMSSGNFGPRPEHMLQGVCEYLYGCNAGNWSAVENETPR